MRRSTASTVLLFGLVAVRGFCQTASLPPVVAHGPEASPGDYYVSDYVEVIDPTAQIYVNFFDQMRDLGQFPVSPEARASLNLTDEELKSLLTITEDLAEQHSVFIKTLEPLIFESRLEIVESDAVSPALREKIGDLKKRWSQTILDRVQRLRTLLGESRFKSLDEFARSGEPLFDHVVPGSTVYLNGEPLAPK